MRTSAECRRCGRCWSSWLSRLLAGCLAPASDKGGWQLSTVLLPNRSPPTLTVRYWQVTTDSGPATGEFSLKDQKMLWEGETFPIQWFQSGKVTSFSRAVLL